MSQPSELISKFKGNSFQEINKIVLRNEKAQVA